MVIPTTLPEKTGYLVRDEESACLDVQADGEDSMSNLSDGFFAFLVYLHGTGITVNGDRLTMFDTLCTVAGSQYCGDSIFTRHNRTVSKITADVSNQRGRMGEQLCPGGRRQW